MINREIKADVVNLITEGEKGLHTMSLDEAINLAEEQGLDVILISDKQEIPIVRIGDYSKFLYEKKRKERENAKKARLNSQETKEIIISTSISEHDLKTKANNVDRILKGNDKVKLTIRYKGREVRLINQGIEKIKTFEQLITVKHTVVKPATIDGKQVSMVVAP